MAVKNRGRPENGFFTREKTMILRKPGLGFRRIAKSCENQNAGKKPLSCIPLPQPTALVFTQTSTQHPISIAPPPPHILPCPCKIYTTVPATPLFFPSSFPLHRFVSFVRFPHTQTPPSSTPAEECPRRDAATCSVDGILLFPSSLPSPPPLFISPPPLVLSPLRSFVPLSLYPPTLS